MFAKMSYERALKLLKKHKSMCIFLIIAFAVPLFCMAIMYSVPKMQSGVGYFILFGAAAISPTIAAFLIVILFKQEDSLSDFLKRCFCSDFNKNLYVVALIIPLIEIVVMQVLLYLNHNQIVPLKRLNFLQILIICYSLIAEEIGWRGFLQNRLSKCMKPFLIPLFTGIVWGFWHYHFYLTGSMSYPVHWFFIGCIADSYIYYWITKKANGNIIPVSLLHFSYNLMSNLFFVSDTSNPRLYPLFVIGSVFAAVFILIQKPMASDR